MKKLITEMLATSLFFQFSTAQIILIRICSPVKSSGMKFLKIVCLFFYLFAFNHKSFGQNLIPNSSFENFDTCPSQMGSMGYCDDWISLKNSPDYFNSCSVTAVSVPDNPLGHQFPRTGNAYCGMVCYYVQANARECIGTQLISPLVVSQRYFISFYLNLSGGLSYTKACNKFGCKLSTVPFLFDSVTIDNAPLFYTDTIVSDTAQWIQISGDFVADSAYNYIAFGNFFDDATTDTLNLDTFSYITYYYIDDICLSTDEMFCRGNPEGVGEPDEDFIKIFPNPCSKSFRIISKEIINEIHLYNLSGSEQRIEYQQENMDGYESYPIEVLNYRSPGIYILKIISLDQITFKKIIIQ